MNNGRCVYKFKGEGFMLKVAYCDDWKVDRDNLEKALMQIEEKWEMELEFYPFICGEDLCESIITSHYDVVLLDIQMEGMDGIETANRIRNLCEDTLIIFISNYDDRVKELFNFGTIAFLDKPVDVNILEIKLRDAVDVLEKNKKRYFFYKKNSEKVFFPIKDIIYFEVKKNIIIIHTIKGKESYYSTLASVWKQVEALEQFIFPGKSYIFNLKYVTIKKGKVVIKGTAETFNIGRTCKVDTEERYKNYMLKRWE